MPGENWQLALQEPLLRALFARELGIKDITAQLLINRGVWSLREAAEFLAGDPAGLPSPWLLKDIDKAVARIKRAVDKRERILVYGDYDADGVTATALLFLTLKALGVEAFCHLPNREQGYGLKAGVLKQVREEGVTLVITADCGVNACEEALLCREIGIDLVVTDHHQPGPVLPEAVAVVNPKRSDCRYPYKDLAGVGVAFKLAAALLDGTGIDAGTLLDLVAIGTVADIVPLTGENRALVRAGLERINSTPRAGIAALLRTAGAERVVTVRTISIFLGPRINAAGRIGDPYTALDLLLCGETEAEEKAGLLETLNQERRRLETLMVAEAQAMVDGNPEQLEKPVLVIAGEGWLPGLTGIVATRLMERYERPVFVIAMNGEQGRGSGRGTPGFDVFKALQYASPYLIEYGGHPGAGGFSVRSEAVKALSCAVIDYARTQEAFASTELKLDAAVKLSDVTPELVSELQLLEPHGYGNPPPRLASFGVYVEEARQVGQNGDHLKLRLRQNSACIDAIGFGLAQGESLPEIIDVVFQPVVSEMTGRVELKIECFRAAGRSLNNYEGSEAGKCLLEKSLKYITQLTDLHLPEEAPPLADETSFTRRQTLVDLREHADRWAVLKELAGRKRIAVVVSTPAAACEVAARLKLMLPEKASRTVAFHSGVLEGGLMRELKTSGAIDILVATPAVAGKFAPETGVVVFDLLHTWRQWNWLRACGGQDIILLYGTRQRDIARRCLRALAPPRQVLLNLYQYLLKQAKQGAVHVKLTALVGLLRDAGVPGPGRRAVENAFKILAELGLINYTYNAGGYSVKMQPAKGKRFLPSAPTFRKQYAVKREMLSCQKHFLIAPAEVLKEYFGCGIISPGGAYGAI